MTYLAGLPDAAVAGRPHMGTAQQAREIAIDALDTYLTGKRPEDLEAALHQVIYILRDGNAGGGDR